MKHKIFCLLFLLAGLPLMMAAQTTDHLIPKPKSMTVADGTLALPASFNVSCEGLDSAMLSEVNVFVEKLNYATGLNAAVTTGTDGLIRISTLPASSDLGTGGYELSVTATGATLRAKEALGLFYGLQTVKKLLPPNVMAAVKDPAVTAYALPLVTISDEPRFQYRGFMLDVSRHFFSVEEVKRMLDVMSYYKMNKFHWHLTDDQGWRAEIKKYPKLTTIGATAPNSRFTSLEEARAYWINRPYGPYYYTQEQMRDVVAYAQKLHIDIIPEIDMPGHFAAAMTAYPEFSCNPDGAHNVWDNGGVSTDVMNVSNPKAMQFIYDVIDELVDIFPYQYIHIGGDECPTTAWQNNADCQQFYKDHNFSSWRQMQSWFISKVDSCVKSKGRRLSMWNESITETGADLDMMKATGAPIYCWYPADRSANVANQLGLPAIYTTWGPYYINRKQGNGPKDPPGAADGSDHVKATYNQNIPSTVDYGVQGTFWCEWVSDSTYMEWLALPRLIAIAEAGWTPQNLRTNQFDDFIARAAQDTVLLNYGGYRYCKYYMPGEGSDGDMVMPYISNDTAKYYYRIISGGTDSYRNGKCIELLGSNSPLLTQNAPNGNSFASYGAQAGRLWVSAAAAEGDANYDNQQWYLEDNPASPGKYALVCKAAPNGSVNPTPTATNNSARWTYDNSNKNYSFTLGTAAYGKKGNNYYYSLTTSQAASGMYMNSAGPGQGYAVNLWSNVNDGNGGQWEFSPMEDYGGDQPEPAATDSVRLNEGSLYVFYNNVSGFESTAITDANSGTSLTHSTDPFAANAWRVVSATANTDGTQTVTLQNAATSRYIGTIGSFVNKQGFPVSVGNSATNITLAPVSEYSDIRIQSGGKSVFPLPGGLVYAGANVDNNATYDTPRAQGAEWTATEVKILTFVCADEQGAVLGTYTRAVPVETSTVDAALCPVLKNLSVKDVVPAATAADTYNVTYQRSAYSVIYRGTDTHGALVIEKEDTVPVGTAYSVALPTVKYYTVEEADELNGDPLALTRDTVISVVYTTDAITGVKADGDPVTSVQAGRYYLMYDATTASGRAGYRTVRPSDNQINRSTSADNLTPNAIWTLEGEGNSFRVKNVGTDLYVPQLARSAATTASTTGAVFTFALNSDGQTWNIKGANGQYWDGVESGALVGWDQGTGHPIRITTFWAQPIYTVTITCVDQSQNQLQQLITSVNAGDPYSIEPPTITGYTFQSLTGAENYGGTVEGHLNITAQYASDATGISSAVNNAGQGSESAAKSQNRIYDLQGRLVSAPQKGIYIRDGRKVKY